MSAHPSSISAPVSELDEAPSPRRAMCLSVNGRACPINVDPDLPLLRVLRQDLGLTGAAYGCTNGRCSACVVHVDDRPTRACRIPVHVVQGAEIVTIEGLAAREGLPPGELHAVQRAWIECNVPPCPCQAGMIMAATALLMDNPDPSEAEIEAAVFLGCGCGVRPHALRAIRSLAEHLRSW
ncbi:2Fe-2S iron-sulfur cluster-binding protein [Dyella sp. BiH032]|uniref:(2Fe-2S)-binding protein n=1 Tax=Dyella sp. BiH032 TaxID=3075430 RepID=UPI002892AF72|nr:2Fe-2S iron-sulfur cluster-binding protein [Dyella sp. BiH032]WNL44630.1 2Fe-2S iron-sulfur cluster-binding protein [Dyella sp. BiH032]